MVAFYVKMIQKGKLTLEDVPHKWRAAVEEALGE